MTSQIIPVGRFAPSPTGRMHLGNVFTAVMSFLSVKTRGGRWILRIEDLDPQRSKTEHARLVEDDLHWLGLDWDEGGLENRGCAGPYSQSMRGDIYAEYFERLRATGLTYPCRCRRADILATQAPHQSDGRIVYAGTCRPSSLPNFSGAAGDGVPAATRLYVPDGDIEFTDRVFGPQKGNLAGMCGDFVLRRADGAWAYQLAVVVDDALMGVTEVVRGCDLLLSTVQQLYLYNLLGLGAPEFAHLPLICNEAGQRLSKRDRSMSMEELRRRYSARRVIGMAGELAGLAPAGAEMSLGELADVFDWSRIPPEEHVSVGM